MPPIQPFVVITLDVSVRCFNNIEKASDGLV